MDGIFRNYKWPGNVREMEHLIQSLVVTTDKETLGQADLPRYMAAREESDGIIVRSSAINPGNRTLEEIMNEIEVGVLRKAIEAHGTISEVARIFKVDRTTIHRKLKKRSRP